MPKHKHHKQKPSVDEVISIGRSKYTASGHGFINPTMSEAPCTVNPDSPYAELLKTLPQLEVVQPPN